MIKLVTQRLNKKSTSISEYTCLGSNLINQKRGVAGKWSGEVSGLKINFVKTILPFF